MKNFIVATKTIGLVILASSCSNEMSAKRPVPPDLSAISADERSYGSPISIGNAPALPGEASAARDIQLLLDGGGSIPQGVINGDPAIPTANYPKMVDGSRSCGLKPGTKVYVVGTFLSGNEYYYVINVDESCLSSDPNFKEGNILASHVKVEGISRNSDYSDLDLSFDYNNEGQIGMGSGSASFNVGCKQVSQAIVVDTDSSKVTGGVARRFDRSHNRNKDCISSGSNVCGLDGESFRLQGRMPQSAGNRTSVKRVALSVKGHAKKWAINVSANGGKKSFPEKRIDHAGNSTEMIIPFVDFIPKNKWDEASVAIKVQGYAEGGEKVGGECIHNLRLISPLVLDFTGAEMIETVHPALAKVSFDLKAEGVAQQSGWIKNTSAFLVLDLNGNGKIDDGSELFGEATKLTNGSYARNGYEALKQYDSNGDGIIDSKDLIFGKLQVWFDKNSDGVTQQGELLTLAEANVTGISVKYARIAEERQHTDGVAFGNRTLYESRFFGPKTCSKDGCKSYDVYFQTNTTSFVKAK